MILYLRKTTDKYELPIAVADSTKELAKMLGTTAGCVRSSLSKKRPGWYKIEIDTEVED